MKKNSMLIALLLWASLAGFAQITDPFFEKTTYVGAFGTTDWTQGWTNWDPQNTVYPTHNATLGDISGANSEITTNTRWASSNSPVVGGASFTNSRLQDPFFEQVGYVGAFGTYDWTQGWSEFDPQNAVYPSTNVTIAAGHITTNQTWTSGNTYLLDGWVYIDNAVTLTIQPGTIIRGSKVNQGALIIERGGKLIANGTADQPIVFTSNVAPGSRTYGDWGGVIICGRSAINLTGGTGTIEGGVGSIFGGGTTPDVNDNSGILRYVRIEFPGIAFSANNEINGLTMGGVGAGTTIDYVQVSYSGDDSFEWFGGTVNAKHLIALRGLDDDFDTDNGFVGKVQFGVSLRDPAIADISESNGFESDNNSSGSAATPVTMPLFSNISIFGPYVTSSTSINSLYRNAMHLRRNTATSIYNSTFSGYPYGLNLDGVATQTNANNNLLQIENVYMTGMVTNNFRAQSTGAPLNWTATEVGNWFNSASSPDRNNATYTNNTDLQLQDPFNLTAPNFLAAKTTYKLYGWVYVRSGATLTIDPGVIIRGDKTSKSALIIERGAQLIANGTANEPIVFASGEAAGARGYGDWGGIILCGNATVNLTGGTGTIEGGVGSVFGGGLTPNDDDNSGSIKYLRSEFSGYDFASNNEINGLTMGGVGRGTTIDHVQISYNQDDSYEWFGGTVNCKHLIAFRGKDDDFDTDNGYSGKVQFAVTLRDPAIADASQSNSFESDNNASGTAVTPETNPTFSNVSSFGPNPAANPGYNTLYRRAMHLRRNTQTDIHNSIFLGWPTGLDIDGALTHVNANDNDLKVENSFISGSTTNYAAGNPGAPLNWTAANVQAYFQSATRNNNDATAIAAMQITDPFNLSSPNFLPLATSPVWGKAVWSRTISGKLLYDKATTDVPVSNSTVLLKNSTGSTTVATATTNATGDYTLYAIDGNYILDAEVNKVRGGLAVVDAVQVRRHLSSLTTLDALSLTAGDVDLSNAGTNVAIIDAVTIRRKLSNQNPIQWQIKDFIFVKPSLTIGGSGLTQDIIVLSGGDVDKSYTPAVQ
ncbi:MAG: hypothetical protein IPN08_08675 [Bacteroidales bacterium]|nr:hypothetical protein [Bacteroidales bacterium]